MDLWISLPVSFYFVPQLSPPEPSGWQPEEVAEYLHELASIFLPLSGGGQTRFIFASQGLK